MKFLISAGPTREKIDPVRFLTNFSSGKMGYALAEAAIDAGHEVVLISGPVSISAVNKAKMLYVESAAEMFEKVKSEYKSADVIIMTAAVADFTPVDYYDNKLKKEGRDNLTIEFKRTVDILAYLGKKRSENQILIGFAAESQNLILNAKLKLNKKKTDWIIANHIGISGIGFQSNDNAVTMIAEDGTTIDFGIQTKKELSQNIIKVILKDK